MKAATEEATDLMETSYAASKGAADYGLKLIDVARANMNGRSTMPASCSR
jgi:hypothetical protein